MKLIKVSSNQFKKLCSRHASRKARISKTVSGIIENVRMYGDEALVKYTKKFDNVKLKPHNFKVSETETSGAYQDISHDFVNTLKVVMENITRFYKKQIKKSWKINLGDGTTLGEKLEPLEVLGVYVPSGQVPLVSSVYMSVLPAKLAGVKKIILLTPPNKYGSVDPHILVVANLIKVDEIYKIGGAQAIAAMAFGTKTIPKVDKIIGPGNTYVTEAKRQVFGYCDIDMIAGPSEVLIIADKYSNPNFIKADLLAQSEHNQGLSILVTTSKILAKNMKKEVEKGFIILVKNLDEAVDVANQLAPEHLEIMVNSYKRIIKKIKHAGAIFVGPYTPVSVGDYIAGPSHVLPTGGTARFFSGLSINDFIKSSHIISYSKKSLENVRTQVEKLATIEGLPKHLESIKIRFE